MLNISVILTDHNEIKGSLELYERGRVPTLFGIEAGTKEGIEFLIYFKNIEEYIFFYKSQIESYKYSRFVSRLKNSAYNILECANTLETFISLAHPYAYGKKSVLHHEKNNYLLDHVYKNIDAIEVYNGTLSINRNHQAFELWQKSGKKFTIGSDGHNIKYLGTTYLEIEKENNFDSDIFFDKFRNNDYLKAMKNSPVNRLRTLTTISRKHTGFFLTRANLFNTIKKAWF